MPEMKEIARRLQENQLQPLKIYPQDASKDINDMLNEITEQMIRDITCNVLPRQELDVCRQVFADAILTNLVDGQAQADLDILFSATLAGYAIGKTDGAYLSQELWRNKLLEPSSKVVYVAVVSDVAGLARDYESVKDAWNRSALLAIIGAFYNNLNAMFLLCDDDTDLQNFKMMANPLLKAAGKQEIPPDFEIRNKIFDGIMLRGNYKLMDSSCAPDSEARILASVATKAWSHILMPTRTIEAFLPSMLVFFNARWLTRATISEMLDAKNDMGKMATLDRSRILSVAKMATLGTVHRAAQKMAVLQNRLDDTLAQSSFRKSTGTFEITRINVRRVKEKIVKVMNKMKNRDVSKNPVYHNFDTFQRPNRREPFNPDLPGMSMDLGYYPDIHLYVDTSGYITQEEYEDSVAMIIDIAKTLNCDIYFNLSATEEVAVRCRDCSKDQIWKDIEKIPKFPGGMTIDQVWRYINATKKNRRQLSLLLSDFYVVVPLYVKHPENLYYIPTEDTVPKFAQDFANQLRNPWRVFF